MLMLFANAIEFYCPADVVIQTQDTHCINANALLRLT
jgi:hypothetical protein